ncbi:MAG: family 20 glycosylhydrolase [Fermentimonas sp.]
MGIQANLWTEIIRTPKRFDFMMFPRISAFAEAAWGTNTDFSGYQERLGDHLSLYQEQGIYYFNPFSPEKFVEPVE